MFAVLNRFRRSSNAHQIRLPRPRHARVDRLECEALEDRMVLSTLSISTMINDNYESANASAWNGRSVAVWTNVFSGTDTDIIAQVFDQNGSPVGSNFVVAGSPLPEHQPSVAMDAWGNFVVTYTLDYAPGSSTVYAVQYDANGNWLNSIKVAVSTQREYDSHVAMAGNGDFVVTCTVDNSSTGTGLDVVAQRYWASGTPRGVPFAVGLTTLNESRSSVACSRDGWFSIAYQREYGGGDFDVCLSRYDNLGNLLDNQAMDTSSRPDINANVAMDDAHNNLVVWQALVGNDWDIYAQRVSSSGIPGGQFIITATAADETNPVVVLNRVTGSFAVAYANSSTGHVWLQAYDPAGNLTAAIDLGGGSNQPALSIDGNGWVMLSYTDWNGIYGNIYGGFLFLP
jgi:YD repeat-containing protein